MLPGLGVVLCGTEEAEGRRAEENKVMSEINREARGETLWHRFGVIGKQIKGDIEENFFQARMLHL